jgi:hypothetical protein
MIEPLKGFPANVLAFVRLYYETAPNFAGIELAQAARARKWIVA